MIFFNLLKGIHQSASKKAINGINLVTDLVTIIVTDLVTIMQGSEKHSSDLLPNFAGKAGRTSSLKSLAL
jgi:hypothetical protein